MIVAGLVGDQISTETIAAVHLKKQVDGVGGAVTSDAIDSDQIIARHLANAAVETTAIKDLAVTGLKIADVPATKLTGTIDVARLPNVTGVGVGTIEASMLKHNAAYTGTNVRVPVVADATGSNKFAKIGGVLEATLVDDVLTFVFTALSGEGSRDFGLAVQTTPPTGVMTIGVPQVRTGWEHKGGTFWSLVSDGGTRNTFRIKDAGVYLFILFASVWGANAAAPGTNTARVSSQLIRDSELLLTTTTKRTGTVTNDEHWHFGACIAIVGDENEDFSVETTVEFVDGVWQQAFSNGDRAGLLMILPVVSPDE
jgi:hypothetical protein